MVKRMMHFVFMVLCCSGRCFNRFSLADDRLGGVCLTDPYVLILIDFKSSALEILAQVSKGCVPCGPH